MIFSITALTLASFGSFIFFVLLPEGPQAVKIDVENLIDGRSNGSLLAPVRFKGPPNDKWARVEINRGYTAASVAGPSYGYTGGSPLIPPATVNSVMEDWGKPCDQNSDCSSNVCGTSCSAQDRALDDSTSCMCPCNGVDPVSPWPGVTTNKCCCGCASRQAGRAYVDICVGNVAAPGLLQIDNGTTDGVFVQKQTSQQSKSMVNSKSASVRNTKTTLGSNSSAVTLPFLRTYPGASGTYGSQCGVDSDCKSGICGTGCDCDSDATGIAVCSCNVPCNAPHNCCGGCFVDNNQFEVDCPLHVTMDYYQAPAQPQPQPQRSLQGSLLLTRIFPEKMVTKRFLPVTGLLQLHSADDSKTTQRARDLEQAFGGHFQGTLDETRLQKVVRSDDPIQVLPLKDGSHLVANGNGRVLAVQKAFKSPEKIEVEVQEIHLNQEEVSLLADMVMDAESGKLLRSVKV